MSETGKNARINNLKGSEGKRFTSENQPTPEAKSEGKQKAKAIKEKAEEIANNVFSEVLKRTAEIDKLNQKELTDLFKAVIDISGLKKQTNEIQGLEDIKITREIV